MMPNKFNEEILKSFNDITGYIQNDRYSNLEIQQFLLSAIARVREDERKAYEAKVVEIAEKMKKGLEESQNGEPEENAGGIKTLEELILKLK